MNRVVRILMERDGLTEEEATAQLNEVREMMAECDYDTFECEEIIMSELGLELDYIMDILY